MPLRWRVGLLTGRTRERRYLSEEAQMIRLPLTMGRDKLSKVTQREPAYLRRRCHLCSETKKPNWTSIFSFVGGLKTFKDLLGF